MSSLKLLLETSIHETAVLDCVFKENLFSMCRKERGQVSDEDPKPQ